MPPGLMQRVEDGFAQIFYYLPQLLAALGILLSCLPIVKFVEKEANSLLHRIGFDRWTTDGGVTQARRSRTSISNAAPARG